MRQQNPEQKYKIKTGNILNFWLQKLLNYLEVLKEEKPRIKMVRICNN